MAIGFNLRVSGLPPPSRINFLFYGKGSHFLYLWGYDRLIASTAGNLSSVHKKWAESVSVVAEFY